MTPEMQRTYLKRAYWRYQKGSKTEKSAILDEFCEVCEISRKHAIRLFNRAEYVIDYDATRQPGPKRKYDQPVEDHLVFLWKMMSKMCSKKMVAALPLWLPFYQEIDDVTRRKLHEISSSTIDRILKPYRDSKLKGKSSTEPSLIKNKIPIKLLDAEATVPGYIEADTVAHCGNSLAGEFINTLTMTDLNSAWTENRATWTKERRQVRKAIKDVERSLPFKIKGFASDNGNEFFNHDLHSYFNDREEKVEFVRRRPYNKNDNAHVEQKNWTHVRELLGYGRFDHPELVDLMNEIYKEYWNPLWNYFSPTMKLKEKTRVGGRITKKYEDAKTPYQRLIESDQLSEKEKVKLESKMKKLNPFKLKDQLEKKLKWFFKIVEIHKNRLDEAS